MADGLSNISKKIICVLRQRRDLSKSKIANYLQLPWSTVATAINALEGTYIHKNTQSSYGADIKLNQNFEYYCGISVGSSNIKIVLCDFNLQIPPKEAFAENDAFLNYCSVLSDKLGFDSDDSILCEWCKESPSKTEVIRTLIREITYEICNLKSIMNIVAICYTFPGYIDYDRQIIVNSFSNKNSTGFLNLTIDALLGSVVINELKKQNIIFFIDHNIKSCTIAEKEHLQNSNSSYNDENLLVLYLGQGISLGMVFNNQLYRGNNNRASEFGKTFVYVNKNGQEPMYKPLEDAIREDVFLSNSLSVSAKDLCYFLRDSNHEENRKLLINILTQAIYNITNILGINKIIFSGKMHLIFKEVEWELISNLEEKNLTNLSLIKSGYKEYSAAAGAAISCYYRKYSCDFNWYE